MTIASMNFGGAVKLGNVAVGRDNNFNLIRALAATAVLVSHAWPIAIGSSAQEPMVSITGYSLGSLAVFLFFSVSGYFISSSFDRTNSAWQFIVSRSYRLFPGLIISMFIVAFLLGPAVTTLPVQDYLSHRDVYFFVFRNIALFDVQYTLPGVFGTNPYPTVEGSIWTLLYEVLCYCLVLLLGVLGIIKRHRLMLIFFILFFAFWITTSFFVPNLDTKFQNLHKLSFPFVVGMVMYTFRFAIKISLVFALLLVTLAYVSVGTSIGFPALVIAIAYGTFFLAYVPRSRTLLKFNGIGDYSYGIYIYAFPVQGLVVYWFGDGSPMLNIAWSLPITILISAASWYIVEAPAIRKANSYSKRKTQ
ncbi:acyltransferase [Cereibacter sp. SYSU M97828]|nr:acyltransferase [Cereibacter flavus]